MSSSAVKRGTCRTQLNLSSAKPLLRSHLQDRAGTGWHLPQTAGAKGIGLLVAWSLEGVQLHARHACCTCSFTCSPVAWRGSRALSMAML